MNWRRVCNVLRDCATAAKYLVIGMWRKYQDGMRAYLAYTGVGKNGFFNHEALVIAYEIDMGH